MASGLAPNSPSHGPVCLYYVRHLPIELMNYYLVVVVGAVCHAYYFLCTLMHNFKGNIYIFLVLNLLNLTYPV